MIQSIRDLPFVEHRCQRGIALLVRQHTDLRVPAADLLAEAPGEQELAVEQMAATYAFKANVQVLKTNDRMMGALLDTKA